MMGEEVQLWAHHLPSPAVPAGCPVAHVPWQWDSMASPRQQRWARRQTWLPSGVPGEAGALCAPFFPALAQTIRSPCQLEPPWGCSPLCCPWQCRHSQDGNFTGGGGGGRKVSSAPVQKRLAIPQSQVFLPGGNNSQFTGFPQGSLVLKCHHQELPWQGTHRSPAPYLAHGMNKND